MVCKNCGLETGTGQQNHETSAACIAVLQKKLNQSKPKSKPKNPRQGPKETRPKGTGPLKNLKIRPTAKTGLEFGLGYGAFSRPEKAISRPDGSGKGFEGVPALINADALVEMLMERVEEDIEHPAEIVMEELLADHRDIGEVLLIDIFLINLYIKPAVSANIMRLFPRLGSSGLTVVKRSRVAGWAINLATIGIYHPDYRIQTSSIAALEKWNTGKCITILEEYLVDHAEYNSFPSLNLLNKIGEKLGAMKTRRARREQKNHDKTN